MHNETKISIPSGSIFRNIVIGSSYCKDGGRYAELASANCPLRVIENLPGTLNRIMLDSLDRYVALQQRQHVTNYRKTECESDVNCTNKIEVRRIHFQYCSDEATFRSGASCEFSIYFFIIFNNKKNSGHAEQKYR